MEKNTIGNRLRKFRYSMDLTQEKLGEKADLHYSYIGQVERGDKTPSLKALIKIADALNISLEELIQDEKIEAELKNNIKLKNINKLLINRNEKELELIYNFLKEVLVLIDSVKTDEQTDKNIP